MVYLQFLYLKTQSYIRFILKFFKDVFHRNVNVGDDLIMEQPTGNEILKCPITSVEIVNKVKNKNCDHCYERDAIVSYIRGKQAKKYSFIYQFDLILFINSFILCYKIDVHLLVALNMFLFKIL
jgi:hypothetical protein